MQNAEEISRVNRLRERFLSTPPAVCSERAKIVTQAYKDYDGDPAVLKRAKTLRRILNEISIFIGDDELIVGNQSSKPRSTPIFPEFSYAWVVEEMDREPFENRDADRFLIDEETKSDLRGLVDFWKGKTINDLTIKSLPEETFNTIKNSSVFTFAPDVVICSGVGHYSPHYKKILEKGFNGIKKDAEDSLSKLGIPVNGKDVEKHNFWKAVIISCEAIIAFAKRYADLAREKASCENNAERKAELLKIAEICEKVPANPARNF